MKLVKKGIMLMLTMCLFSGVVISNVYAANKKERFENDSNSFLTSVLKGEYEYDTNGNKTTSEFFDGNYILLCKYKVKLETRNDYVNANLYYSLKKGSRGIYTVIYNTYAPEFFIHKGTTKTITGNRILGGGNVETGFANARKYIDEKYGSYFVVETEDKIIANLSLGTCPYYAYYDEIYNDGYEGNIQTAQGFTNNKDGAKYQANMDLKDEMDNARKSAEEKVGTIQDVKTVDENGQSIESINESKLVGQLYSELRTACKNNESQTTKDSIINKYMEQAEEIYENEWKTALISSKNDLSAAQKNAISLPYVITGKNDDSSMSIYKNGYNTIVSNLNNVIYNACIRDDKLDLDQKLENGEITQEEYEEEKEKLDGAWGELEDEVDKNRYEIVPESEKPRGCDVFGPNITKLIKYAYNLLKYGAPILVIIMGILDFAKAFMSGEEKGFKEAWQKFIKRIIAAVVVILLPILITFILDLSGVLEQYGIEGKGNDIYCIFKS